MSGLKPQNTAIASWSSQHRMSGLLSSMLWRVHGHSVTGFCGCQNGIPLLCIMSSLSAMTCLITWIAWCELWPRRRHNGRKTSSVPWSLRGNSCPNIILKWLQWLVSFSFWQICSILSRCCEHLGSGTREWMLILKARLRILPNTRRPFWSMCRTNTALNIDVCQSLNLKAYRTTISSPLQWILDLVKCLMSYMICLAMMKNT